MPRIAAAVLAAVLALAAPSLASAAPPPGCATGSATSATKTLFGKGTELVKVGRVAGMRSALALEPRVYPGTRRRMVRAGGQWCDATSAFNATGLKGADAARAYVSVAAAPYFDGVTVRSIDETAPGVFAITTHARTNGVVAAWLVTTDAAGVRTATWTATGFAQRPFVAEIEGLTALPEATETYDRVTGNLLRARGGLPTSASTRADDEPGVGVSHEGSDGFVIDVHAGDAPVAPQLGMDIGVWDVDFLRIMQRALAENYEEFLAWGLTKGWDPGDSGFLAVNDALSAYCLACVLIGDDFNIHVNSHAHEALELLGYSYPGADPEVVWTDIIGHEMFHNFQNRYVQPGPVTELMTRDTVGGFYSEGTARMQESLHTYNHISHQEQSLIYADDANGCNGFDQSGDMDEDMAGGVFTSSRSYSTCFFWMAWYAEHGWDGLKELMTNAMPAAKAEDGAFEEGMTATVAATGDSVLTQLQDFARHALTGGEKTWGAIAGGPELDWNAFLERWEPQALQPGGEPHTRTLEAGGLMANEITKYTRIRLTAPKDVKLFSVEQTAAGVVVRDRRTGVIMRKPRAGERIWILAARPVAGESEVTITPLAP